MSRYYDLTNDMAFKKIFSDKVKLIDLLNSILKLEGQNRIQDLDYLVTEQLPLFLNGKASLFDLKVRDQKGLWYIVEMQKKTTTDYLNRAQLYGCHSYVSQLEQGMMHKDLLPVVVISIIGTTVFPNEIPCISFHHLKETTTNKQYLFSLTYVFIELGKFEKKNIESDTDAWLHVLKYADDEIAPPEGLSNDAVLATYDNLEKFRWNWLEQDAYFRAEMTIQAEEDKYADMKEQIIEAQEKATEAQEKATEAEAQCDEMTKLNVDLKNKMTELVQALINTGHSTKDIAKIANISETDIMKLIK